MRILFAICDQSRLYRVVVNSLYFSIQKHSEMCFLDLIFIAILRAHMLHQMLCSAYFMHYGRIFMFSYMQIFCGSLFFAVPLNSCFVLSLLLFFAQKSPNGNSKQRNNFYKFIAVAYLFAWYLKRVNRIYIHSLRLLAGQVKLLTILSELLPYTK